MLSGRTVSIDFVIEWLYQDYGFENINKPDVIEWIWKSMGIIGSPYPYEDKPVELIVENYRAELPLDYYGNGVLREKTSNTPLREMTDVFSKFEDSAYEGTTEIISDYDPAYPYISDAENTVDHYDTIIGPDTSSQYYTFKMQGNFIYFGFETGTVQMQYKAIPIDIVTGMPTIPDNVIYIRGIVSFIAERMAFKMMLKDMLSERKYEIIRQDYFFNVGAAKSICILPSDPGRMETLINRWKSTYLGPGHFDTGFKYSGSRE